MHQEPGDGAGQDDRNENELDEISREQSNNIGNRSPKYLANTYFLSSTLGGVDNQP
jgi:hypothetical protein